MTPYPLSPDQLEEGHALVLGTTGSGKTYTLRGAIQGLVRAGRRVGAIDKLGNHWGLTLAADGKGPGLDMVIFGGKRAHVPMSPGDGERLARLFVTRNIPAIFDLSQWPADEQQHWVADFADTVFRLNEAALHLTFDEAQSWVPQGGGGEAFRAVLRLAEQGRGNGIRLLLSVQRLSRLDATVRGMMHSVVAMRQTSTIDRKAVRDLVASSAEDAAMLDRDLPALPAGAGLLWDPLQARLTRVDFPANATFDSSRTPRHGDAPPPPPRSTSALVEELKKALAKPGTAGIADKVPADPAAAYAAGTEAGEALADRDRRIAELENQVADLTAEVDHLREVGAECDRYQSGLGAIEDLVVAIRAGKANLPTAPATLHETAKPSKLAPPPSTKVEPARPGAADAAVRGAKALAVLARIHPAGLTETQWAGLAKYAKSGGTWGTYKGALRAGGLVEQRGDLWYATPAGISAAGVDPAPLPAPGRDRAAFWGAAIPGVSRMVTMLTRRWPHFTTREALAADLGMAADGGTFGTYLGRLRANGLLEEQGKRLRLGVDVMGPAK